MKRNYKIILVLQNSQDLYCSKKFSHFSRSSLFPPSNMHFLFLEGAYSDTHVESGAKNKPMESCGLTIGLFYGFFIALMSYKISIVTYLFKGGHVRLNIWVLKLLELCERF